MRQKPLMDCGSRQNGCQAASRNPSPPVTDPRQVGKNRTDRAKRLGAGGGDATYSIGPHEDQFGPAESGCPTEQQTQDQEWNSGAALARNAALTGNQCADQEEALVAAPHGERGCSHP